MATPAFLERWRVTSGRQAAIMASFTLKSSTGGVDKVLRVANTPLHVDGTYWHPILGDITPIGERVGFCGSEVPKASTEIRLNRAGVSQQAEGETVLDLLGGYHWVGATVDVWFWELGLTDFATDAELQLPGIVVHAEVDISGVTLTVKQRNNWDRPVQSGIVSRDLFPNTPQDTLGSALGVFIGRRTAPAARAPWTQAQPIAGTINFARRPARVHQGVLTDPGFGYGNVTPVTVRAYLAGNQLSSLGSTALGTGVFLKLGDRLCLSVPIATGFDPLRGTWAEFRLDSSQTYIGCPVSSVGSAPPAGSGPLFTAIRNSGVLANPDSEYRFASADENRGHLVMYFAGVEDLGYIGGISAFIGLRTRTNGLGQFDWTLKAYDIVNGYAYFNLNVPQSATPTVWLPDIWNDTAGGQTPGWSLSNLAIAFVNPLYGGPPRGEVDLFFAYVVIRFSPRRALVDRIRDVSRIGAAATQRQPVRGKGAMSSRPVPKWVPRMATMARQLEGTVFSNGIGPVDDGSGTYTGTPGAVIERLPDVARYLLKTYGGEQDANFEMGVGEFGSLIDARDQLKTWRYGDMIYELSIAEPTTMSQVLSWLSACGPALINLSRHTNKWRVIPWRPGAAQTYDLAFGPEHILKDPGSGRHMISAKYGPSAFLSTAVQVDYAWDADRRSFTEQVMVDVRIPNRESSRAGRDFFDLRHASSEVVAGLNDKLDFLVTGSTQKNATLTAGSMAPEARATDVKVKMEAVEAGRYFYVAHGFNCHRVAVGGTLSGFKGNDWIRFWQRSGVLAIAALTLGDMTPEERAADAQAALNAADSAGGWVVSYSRLTRKFTFSVPSGGAGLAFGVTTEGGTARERSAAAMFGFTAVDKHTGTSWTSDYECEPERFRMTPSANTLLMFASGTNGFETATPKSCSQVLGFEPSADSPSGLIHVAVCPKSDRETLLKTTRDRYSVYEGITVDARAISDSATAHELNRRLIDLMGVPRAIVEFPTEYAPDIEVGHVFPFKPEMDDVLVCPDPDSGGSWQGRTLVVVEVEQMMGPKSLATRIVAVDLKEAA